MTKKIIKELKIMPKRLMAFMMIFVMLVSYFAPMGNMYALQHHGEGEHCFSFDMDANGFPVSSVTINGEVWDKNDDHRYYSDDNVYTIVVLAGMKGNQHPWISTPGGIDDYKVYTAVENPGDKEEVIGDEFILTLKLNNLPYEGVCSGIGISLQDGPFPVAPEIHTETDVNITISGDELEYHYVADKPDEADVTYFKFGINSGISEDIVPFTFGNANYTYNDNEPPKNVSSVTTKQPIHYEYTYDGSGFVTFYVNGGATDEYTKIEINGVDYSDQAPHSQIEYFEHLIGRALIFEIHDVPYADTYDVVVEGKQTALENRVGSIGWSYLSRERSGLSDDEAEGNFAHGKLEFVSAKYTDVDGEVHEFNSVEEYNNTKFHGTGEIYAWHDGMKDYPEIDRRLAWGESQVPYGTELTLRIVPDSGYQLVGLAKSPTGFTATDEVGVYKIVLTAENFLYGDEHFDLQPVFERVDAEVTSDSVNVKSGNITINENFENGTAKLEVNDVISMSPERVEEFENLAEEEEYDLEYYLDIALYNSIYKGGKTDANGNYESWDTPVDNIEEKATVTLELENDLRGKEVAIIHEKHNGNEITGYELIDAVYNEENNTITFETDSFSSYALVSKAIVDNTKYIVHFDSRGGTPIEDKEVTAGTAVAEPPEPENGDLIFDGWFEDETLNARFFFNTPITGDLTLYAKWLEPNNNDDNNENNNVETEVYTEEDESGNIVIFKDESGLELHFNSMEILHIPEEDIEGLGVTVEQYNQIKALIMENTKDKGTLIALYEFMVTDNEGHEHADTSNFGSVEIRILMTEEMKKYNTFKLVNLDDEFNAGTTVTLTAKKIDGKDYLVGILPHLSIWSLNATNVASNPHNPHTGDNTYMWVGILAISAIGLSTGMVISKKLKKSRFE